MGAMIKNICCIGAGYVGGPTCAVIACKNPSITVNVVDLSVERIKAWNSLDLPIAEPGLLEMIQIGRDGIDGRTPNLHFTTEVDRAIVDADLIFISVNTPTKKFGRGANQALDVTWVEAAVERIARVAADDKIVVQKSTVSCGTAKIVKEILVGLGRPGLHFEVLSNPEFLAEGTAIRDLLEPDRVLIGSDPTESGYQARRILSDVYNAWVPKDRIISMDTNSAELAKLAANTLLAQRISSINALSAICEATGADVEEVAFACGLDTRIGSKMLRSSIGFGGSCFKKDTLSLAHFSDSLQLPDIGSYWRSVNDINERQKARFAHRIVRRMHNTISGKKVALLGCSYKKNTGDIRESAAISIAGYLISEQARITVYDPRVKADEFFHAMGVETGMSLEQIRSKMRVCSSAYEACHQAQAVVIATEWDEFNNRDSSPSHSSLCDSSKGNQSELFGSDALAGEIQSDGQLTPPLSDSLAEYRLAEEQEKPGKVDWRRVASLMRYPKLVFDGRNVVDSDKLRALGMQVECVGKPGYRG